ncbi:MAG: mannonate dehydratase [Candidatus Latescibacterota bacterium]|nr:mannonate dehydratase [Candidatus Latescibacterota bacterium]
MFLQDQISWADLDTDWLDFLRAIGVDTIHLETRQAVDIRGHEINIREGTISSEPFDRARDIIEAKGMRLNNVFYSCPREVPLGLAGADEAIDVWCRLLEALGQAGVPALGWNYKPMGNFRTPAATGRGRVKYSTFDLTEFMANRPEPHAPAVSEAEMFERIERFLKAVLPVAEKSGVTMALHPDDPPVPEALGGVAQVCSTTDQFRRIFDLVPSERHRMLFCQGCMTELLGQGVYDFIAEMAAADKIQWVHFRNVRGQLPRFEEVFLDEGDIDMRRAMEIYRDNGFQGPFMMDHTPSFPSQNSARLGKAYANGYIRSLIQQVYG